MPLQKFRFRPGINREVTSYTNEGGWHDCDKVRFVKGYPEKIGGMQLPGGVQFNGMQILNDAQEEIRRLEEEMIVSYSLPVTDLIG